MAVPDGFTASPASATPHQSSLNNYTSHLHASTKTTAPPYLPDKLPPSGITHCGFEGPEKLLEIWFLSTARSESPDSGLGSGPLSPAMATPAAHTTSSHHNAQTESNSFDDRWYADDGNLDSDQVGLRIVPREVWNDMLAIVKAQILSTVHNEYADGYLLSESSMFVYPRKLILKTCGTTTLLHAVPRILEIASHYGGFHHIDHIFYSRKAFLFPDKQIFPHGRWDDEVSYLDYLFPQSQYNTAGYVVGKVNGDHWCCYLATPRSVSADDYGDGLSFESSPSREHSDSTRKVPAIPSSWSDSDSDEDGFLMENDVFHDDVTLEIMMTDGDCSGEESGKEELRVYNETGLADIYPTSKVDHHVFDPCGYSLNGLMGPYYWTVHVTPEEHCSYASFETSAPVRKYYPAACENHIADGHDCYDTFEEVINRVVSCFRPSSFCVSLFTRRSVSTKHRRGVFQGRIPGFDRRDCIRHESGKWEVVFSRYEKKDL
ncbi:adenosylmethionine decarboxylase [Synchytrium endobioticum]|nr:adenosylmethionine decarboxylase [Synchytrium endobioticum]